MTHSRLLAVGPIGRSTVILLAGLAIAAAMLLAVLAGPVSQARAEGAQYFCYYSAAPYGKEGDRCYNETNIQHLTLVQSYGYEHSACSDAYFNGLVASWACAPVKTWSTSYFDGTRYLEAVIRNNTTGASNLIWGYQEWL